MILMTLMTSLKENKPNKVMMRRMEEHIDDVEISMKHKLICLILKNRLNDRIFTNGKSSGK